MILSDTIPSMIGTEIKGLKMASLDLLIESGALLEGHFLLASGKHSGRYAEKFRILENL